MNYLSKINNLQKMYLIRAFRGSMFSIAIIGVLFRETGLSATEIMLLQSLFSLAVIVFEAPTGHFADNYGRKESIVIGIIFSTIGYAAYSMAHGFYGFLTGEIILAAGCCFVSGADSAIIYENTDVSSGSGAAIKAEGNGASIAMFSEAITSFIGGSFLSLVSLRFPVYFDVLIALAALPVAISLEKEAMPQKQCRENSIWKVVKLFKFSLHDHKELKWLIFYSSVVSSSTLTMVWLIPIFWEVTKTPKFMFGTLWAIFVSVSALVAYRVHAIEESLGRKKSLIILFVLPSAGYFLISFFEQMWAMVFILLFYVARGMNNPIMKSYINGLISSEDRATILSSQSLLGRLPFVFIGPLAGWIHDNYSLQAAFFVCACLFAFAGIISLAFLHKHKAL